MPIELRAELHCHSIHSDGFGTIEECVKTAKKKGLDIIAITDHDTAENTLIFWKKQPEGILVIPGVEISTDKGHVLGLFVKQNIQPGPLEIVIDELKKQDAIGILAHPFHKPLANRFRKKKEKYWEDSDIFKVDCIEIYNGHNRSTANKSAVDWAKNYSITATSGSDAHFLFEIGNAVTIVYVEENTLDGIKKALRDGQTKPSPPKSNHYIFYLVIAVINKVKKFFISLKFNKLN